MAEVFAEKQANESNLNAGQLEGIEIEPDSSVEGVEGDSSVSCNIVDSEAIEDNEELDNQCDEDEANMRTQKAQICQSSDEELSGDPQLFSSGFSFSVKFKINCIKF